MAFLNSFKMSGTSDLSFLSKNHSFHTYLTDKVGRFSRQSLQLSKRLIGELVFEDNGHVEKDGESCNNQKMCYDKFSN